MLNLILKRDAIIEHLRSQKETLSGECSDPDVFDAHKNCKSTN
jgi:hypothetical protein